MVSLRWDMKRRLPIGAQNLPMILPRPFVRGEGRGEGNALKISVYQRLLAVSSSFSLLPSVQKIRVHPCPSVVKLRLPSPVWRFATYWLIISLLGSDPRLDFWTLHAQSCDLPSNSSTDTVRLTYFAYDFDGHLTQINSPEGVINYGYDIATGRHTSTCTANSYVTYDYDQLGRLQHVNALKRNGAAINETTTYSYDKVGNRQSVTLPSGIVTSYGYDSLNRLTGLTNLLGGTNLLSSYTYQLHPTGRRTNAVEVLKTEDSTSPWITNHITWQYDGMYRLVNEFSVSSTNSAWSYTNTFQYDQVGNRFSKVHSQNGATTAVTNLFNDNDQLLREVTLSDGTPIETNSYAYASNGSLLAKTNISSSSSTTLYAYDLKNKLSSVTAAGGSTTNFFLYNDSGIRVQSSSSSGGSPTLYLVDANNRTGYAEVLEELNTVGGAPIASYVMGDEVLAQCKGTPTAPSYFLQDGHGNNRQLAGLDATISSHFNYDAYGSVQTGISSSSAEDAVANTTSKLYCGEQYDANLHMYNLRARYYNPANGRFNQLDTFEGFSDDPQSLHKYTYANSDPINGIDPTGQFTVVELLVVTGILAILGAILLPAIAKAKQNAKNQRLRALNKDPLQDQIDSGQINLHEFLLMPADQQEEQLKWIYDNGVRQQQIELARAGNTILACNMAEGFFYANDAVGLALGFGGVMTVTDIGILGQGSEDVVQLNEITTYASFKARSRLGDSIDGHELWMFANQKAIGAATTRLGGAASRNNPVIALDHAMHVRVNAAQAALNPATMTPLENIDACAAIMRRLNAASPEKIDALQKLAIQHAKSLGY
ncbi:MAG: hypothetical protein C5B50_18570 [Verrucomicrobia bacterium]|nr:MAG: hypothetical protein C5B50_18570 [Verrucomicrobiota bacterium]